MQSMLTEAGVLPVCTRRQKLMGKVVQTLEYWGEALRFGGKVL
jgi:hypothetical protein